MLVRRIAAPPDAVLRAVVEPIVDRLRGSDRSADRRREIRWGSESDVAEQVERFGEVTADGEGSTLRSAGRDRPPPSVLRLRCSGRWSRGRFAGRSQHMADVIEARVDRAARSRRAAAASDLGAARPDRRRPGRDDRNDLRRAPGRRLLRGLVHEHAGLRGGLVRRVRRRPRRGARGDAHRRARRARRRDAGRPHAAAGGSCSASLIGVCVASAVSAARAEPLDVRRGAGASSAASFSSPGSSASWP